jgi:phosphatidylglycerophosphate synthase
VIADAVEARRPAEVEVKGRDCWWTVLVIDPLATPLVRALLSWTRITPNLLTAAAVLVAAVAAGAFAAGHMAVGAILFQVSFLIDCMDGKLAHTRRLRSRYGSYIDAVGDALRFVGCTAGLAFGVASGIEGAAGWIVLLATFPALHYVRLTTQAAWPDAPHGDPMVLTATPLALLRAAPGRLSKPATTVDTEAIVFTIGPLMGLPLEGLLAAAALDGLRLVASIAIGIRKSTREAPDSPRGSGR